MSYPESVFNSPKIRKANWLGRYLEVENKSSVEIHAVLESAERSIVNYLATIGPDGPISATVRRAQLNLALKSVRKVLRGTFGSVTDIVRDKQGEAAVAAVDAGLFDERGIMKILFPNSVERQNYADSLRETAKRNIQATITRTLKTEQPLSARVWKTNALANGMVSKAVNDALARGESAEQLAKSISHLVRPDTPGGISYAAMRLARTEINNAFHAQSIADAQEKPWLHQMRWNLSKVHAEDPGDACESYAQIGLFDKERVPVKPHPNCRCFVTSEVPDYQEFEDNLVMGHYNKYLDSVMGEDYSANRPQPGVQYTGFDTNTSTARPVKLSDIKDYNKLKTPEQVAQVLSAKYPGLDVSNFTSEHTKLNPAKEIARGIDHMMQKYPDSSLKAVVLGDGPDGEWARTIRKPDGTSIIKWNRLYTSNPSIFEIEAKVSTGNGYHPPGSDWRPFYTTTLHEFGHVLDNDGNQMARQGVDDIVLSALEKAGVPETDSAIKAWYESATPSLYGLEEAPLRVGGWAANDGEILAEAFLDVELNGDSAKPISKQLNDLLMESRRTTNAPLAGESWSPSLTATIDDEGLLSFDDFTSVEDIALQLNYRYSVDVDGDLGFNDLEMDLKVAKELGNQFVYLQDKYPEVHIQRMENIDFIDDTTYAMTYPDTYGSRIAFNSKYTENYRDFAQAEYQGMIETHYDKGKAIVKELKVGFHPAGSADEPAKSVMTHEWAHALDTWIQGFAPSGYELSDIQSALWNECFGVSTGIPELPEEEEWKTWWMWMKDNMSGYSFEKGAFEINREEALAEAFDDVERNGDRAFAGSKVLYRLMMQKRDEALKDQAERLAYQLAKKAGKR